MKSLAVVSLRIRSFGRIGKAKSRVSGGSFMTVGVPIELARFVLRHVNFMQQRYQVCLLFVRSLLWDLKTVVPTSCLPFTDTYR